MITKEQIRSRLEQKIKTDDIRVTDLTGTQNHWQVEITSSDFKGLTKIEQHRKINDIFQPELHSGEIHALSLKTKEN